ncbi:MAG: HEPN domain-containing protein [Thermoanaerobaculia bacterium]
MARREKDWFAQAERDLAQAVSSREEGRHEWVCFAAQQAGEKAAKALHLSRGQEGWGHVVARLLHDAPVAPPTDLADKAKVLDNFYFATRYANGHPEGAPFEHYGPLQSGQAIDHARDILEFVRRQMA